MQRAKDIAIEAMRLLGVPDPEKGHGTSPTRPGLYYRATNKGLVVKKVTKPK